MRSFDYYKCIAAIVTLFAVVGCKEEFLDRPPLGQLTDATYYKTDQEVIMATAPLYSIVWFDYNDKSSFAIGDARAGNMISNSWQSFYQFSVAASDQSTLTPAYTSFYKIIGQSNMVISNVNRYATTASEPVKRHAIAEARFMRGLAYAYLVRGWGEIPIIYDNLAQAGDTSISKNTIASIWEFIIRDMRYAAQHLPANPIAVGRLSKWSAEGMLAKMYLTRSGVTEQTRSGVPGPGGLRNQKDLDSARYYAGDVIKNSGLSLMPKYGDLFFGKNNNNPESLFALQWMAIRDPWGVNNSFQAYMAYDPKVTGTGDGWGRAHGASADLIKFYLAHPEDSLRRKATFMFHMDHYPEILSKSGGLLYNPGYNDVANIKKYIIGTPEDNGGKGNQMNAYINTYMLRLAEVYLIYAEAILGNNETTSDQEALAAFNVVRTRAGVPAVEAITFQDVLNERRIELAMEGNYWYDIIRYYYFNPTKAKELINDQDKGPYTLTYVAGSKNPREYTVTFPETGAGGAPIQRKYPVSDQTIYLPIPESEMAKAPNLRKPPVPFNFSVMKE